VRIVRGRVFVACCLLTGGLLARVALGQQDASAQNSGGNTNAVPAQNQSLGDIARKLRKDGTAEVRMNADDTKKLFETVDKVFAFAVVDTGMPKRAVIKRQLVSKADVEKFMSGRLARQEFTKRFATAELSMKKLGFLPREFNLREFLVRSTGQQVAGYYDEESKSISLLNWVPPDRQGPILAHELTHALQDQNYDLKNWMKAATKPGAKPGQDDNPNDDGASARHAVVEGQAMVVYVDYLLAPLGRSLQNTPGLIYQMEEPAVKAVPDSQMLHDAPIILREAGSFAYNEGLIFEGELLQKGGKTMAFAGAFTRPPRNTHEVLQPSSYINGEKLPPVGIPDMHQLLNGEYEVYDSGGVGELDVRALLKQYGERKIADELSSAWQGGVYVAFRRGSKDAATVAPTTADLAVLYVSHWKSPQAAERFAHFYATAVSQRYRNALPQSAAACAGAQCPVSVAQLSTEEGPVIIEHWAENNSVIISESFDSATAAKLLSAVRNGKSGIHAENLGLNEFSSRLDELPAFRDFEDRIGELFVHEMSVIPKR
jgi:hypothetical protein